MILISRDESLALREKYGDTVGISITNRTKKGGRKKYYVEETQRVLYFIDRFRNRLGSSAKIKNKGAGQNDKRRFKKTGQ